MGLVTYKNAELVTYINKHFLNLLLPKLLTSHIVESSNL